MAKVTSRRQLLDEMDDAYAQLELLIARVPSPPRALWTTSSVNSGGWSLKDVLAHVADWAQRCDRWCEGLESSPPGDGFTWSETRELNRAIHAKRRKHSLARVLRDLKAGHIALRTRAAKMRKEELLGIGCFAWCGPTWSVAKHLRANTTAHYRWAARHFKKALRDATPRPRASAKARG